MLNGGTNLVTYIRILQNNSVYKVNFFKFKKIIPRLNLINPDASKY